VYDWLAGVVRAGVDIAVSTRSINHGTVPSTSLSPPALLSRDATQRQREIQSTTKQRKHTSKAPNQENIASGTHAPAAGRCWISLALLTPALPDDTSIVRNSHKKRRPLGRAPAYTDTPRMAMARERERGGEGSLKAAAPMSQARLFATICPFPLHHSSPLSPPSGRKFYASFGKRELVYPAGRGHRGSSGERGEDLIDVVGRGRVLQLGFAAGGNPRPAAGSCGRGVASRRSRAEQARPPRLVAGS
jgi:hypothetical protein